MKYIILLLLSAIVHILGLNQGHFHDYCVIGAGPAGIQLAYFLHKAKRNYIVYEKSSQAGRFRNMKI